METGKAPFFLAYGGTGFFLRKALGIWDEGWKSYEGVLGDRWGVSDGHEIFGIVFPAGRPTILYRCSVRSGERLYPFGFLLVPGADVLRADRWNPIFVLRRMKSDRELWDTIIGRPEDLSRKDFDGALQPREASPEVRDQESSVGEIQELWTGMMFQKDGRGIPAGRLGLRPFPAMEEISPLLDSLPPAFAAGIGWMSAGAEVHSRALGNCVYLVGEEHASISEAKIDIARRIGAELLEVLRSPSCPKEMPEAFNALLRQLQIPLALWKQTPDSWRRKLKLWFRAFAAHRDGVIGKEFFEEQNSEVTPWLCEALIKGSGDLDAGSTGFLLEMWRRELIEISSAAGRRLEPETTVAWLMEHRIDLPGEGLGLPDELIRNVRLRRLENADPEKLAEEITGVLPGLTQEEKDQVVELVRMRIVSDDLPLRSVAGHTEIFRPFLEETARVRALAGRPRSWIDDHLDFGNDPGGKMIATSVGPEDAARIVDAVLSRTGSIAVKWIRCLETSPLRLKCPLRTLRTAAERGPWYTLLTLITLFEGKNVREPRPVDEREIPFLSRELKLLFDDAEDDRPAPNLPGILQWEPLFRGILESAVNGFHPSMIRGDVRGYLAGILDLKAGNPEPVLQGVLDHVRVCGLPQAELIPDALICPLARAILWNPTVTLDSRHKESAHCLVTAASDRLGSSCLLPDGDHIPEISSMRRFLALMKPPAGRFVLEELVKRDPRLLALCILEADFESFRFFSLEAFELLKGLFLFAREENDLDQHFSLMEWSVLEVLADPAYDTKTWSLWKEVFGWRAGDYLEFWRKIVTEGKDS